MYLKQLLSNEHVSLLSHEGGTGTDDWITSLYYQDVPVYQSVLILHIQHHLYLCHLVWGGATPLWEEKKDKDCIDVGAVKVFV